jgi:Rieske Fe-S protein
MDTIDRKKFIKQCGFACLGVLGTSILVQGCTSSKQINAPLRNNQLQVKLSSFAISGKDNSSQYKRYVVVQNEQLNYPIVVYRNGAEDYTALLLRCSHQYNELNVNGELVSCSAHGSEFDSKGSVVNGPADTPLRSFPITKDNQYLYIQLA